MKTGSSLKYLILWIPLTIFAQDNNTCVTCHEDESLSVRRSGIELSLFVTDDHLTDTPHEGFSCIDCHTALEGITEFPHSPLVSLPECGSCHPDAQAEFIEGFFKPLLEKAYSAIPNCSDCHGKHKISWVGRPQKVCGICHQDILKEFNQSRHWGLAEDNLTCVSCHKPHFKYEKEEHSPESWKMKLLESCHKCHENEVNTFINSKHFEEIEKGNLAAPICSDCHARHKVLSPHDPESLVSVAKLDLICSRCHIGYEASIHRPESNSDPRLETCVVCHTGHSTNMTEANSSVFDMGISNVCLKCHEEMLRVKIGEAHYNIHDEQIEMIDQNKEADCGNCHQYHYNAPEHPAFTGIKRSCGECHPRQQLEYEQSSHYYALVKGHKEAPNCITCHGERDVLKTEESFQGQSIVALCSSCHSDREVTLKFQLNPEVVAGYNTSYHGQMYQLGYQGEAFATCVSCHDNHSVLPHTDPMATTHQENIMKTCGNCHKSVNINFVSFLQHYTPMVKAENIILEYIHTFMLWLLGVTLFIFGGHTLLWLIRLIVRRINEGPLSKPPKSQKRVRRFDVMDRIMHLGIIISFLTLALTGLPLKYSHAPLANWFAQNVIGFRTAAIMHRSAATLIGIIFLYHILSLLYLKFFKQQKGLFWGTKSLVPRWQDIKDFFNHLSFFIGARKTPPAFGRWTYWEKFDYFAVFWGMIIIGSSGLILWFPEIFTRILPGWFINAAHIIHSEEALLATAFIFTIHFFNTHLRPGAFPMDEVIFTGRLTEEKFKEERPLQFAELGTQEYEAMLTDPLSKGLKRLFYIAGYTFLLLGFFLLVLIFIGTFI
ncbi:MAG: cytochrome c3 family protein [Candidatus Neomarinimicrobiota bacterium]